MANTDGYYTMTEPAVMAHPALHKPRAFKNNGKDVGEPKYGLSIVLDPKSPEWPAIKAHAAAVAKAAFGTVEGVKFPFKKGDTLADQRKAKGKEDGEFQRGKVVLAARSKFPPKLAGMENGRLVDYDTDEKIAASSRKFYFGAEVLALLNFFTTDIKGEKRVSVYVNAVMVTGKGTKLGGGASAAETFSGYRGAISAEDPTDDEIPF